MTPRDAELPAPLRPWAALFDGVPQDHWRAIASLMRALAPLIDRAQAFGPRSAGELDALTGVGTRGGVERLAASEWLWRDLAPDEFLRRVAEREALTVEPAYRQAEDPRTVMALVDAGPHMLGRPRLVGFAALLCFADAARRSGGRLLWWSTAFEGRGWCDGLGRDDAVRLLVGVAAATLGEADLRGWRGFADATPRPARPGTTPLARACAAGQGLWLIGPAGLAEGARTIGADLVAVEERSRLDDGALVVAGHVAISCAARGRVLSATLDLPDEATSAALLRDPFRRVAAAAPRRRPTPASPGWMLRTLAFTPGGDHLFVALPDGVLMGRVEAGEVAPLCRIPVAPHQRLIGIDAADGCVTVATVNQYGERARVVVRRVRFDGRKPENIEVQVTIAGDHALAGPRWEPGVLPILGRPGRRGRVWVLAPDGSAWLVAADGVAPFLALPRSAPVLSAGQEAVLYGKADGGVAAHARRDGSRLASCAVEGGFGRNLGRDDLVYATVGRARCIAVRTRAGWRLHGHPAGALPSELPVRDGEALAAILPEPPDGEPKPARRDGVVIVLSADGRVVRRDLGGAVPDVDVFDVTGSADRFDLVRVGTGSACGSVVAGARLDPRGFAVAMSLAWLASGRRVYWNVPQLAAGAPCFPG